MFVVCVGCVGLLGECVSECVCVCPYRGSLDFNLCQDLKNPWNDSKPVKISRDGQVSLPLSPFLSLYILSLSHPHRRKLSPPLESVSADCGQRLSRKKTTLTQPSPRDTPPSATPTNSSNTCLPTPTLTPPFTMVTTLQWVT